MHADIHHAVHAILSHGLTLRDRLEGGEAIKLEATRDSLLALLKPLRVKEDAEKDEEDELADFDFEQTDAEYEDDKERLSQLSIRYALTCWLDELLLQSSWGERWRNATLESILFVDRLRTKKFWDEARYAEIRGDIDALNVMYWCVMLGYRGDWATKPEQVETWTARIRQLLEKFDTRMDTESLLPRADAPEDMRPAENSLQRMQFVVLTAMSGLASAALLLFWRQMIRS